MSASNSGDDPESAAQQIERLLAKSIGPMAKIVVARARKRAVDEESLLQALAKNIDDDAERARFIAAAGAVLAARPKTSDPVTLSSGPAAARQDTPAPAETTAAARVPGPVPEIRTVRPASAFEDDDVMKPGAIFVSYARDNLGVAMRLVDALRRAGFDVWLDMGKLQPGDAWDVKIRRNIEACSFFVPLISRETDARREGYFRREWNIAADRALNFADDEPFLLPVTIDELPAHTARVPERFRAAHWTALPDGETTPEFIEQLRRLVDGFRQRRASG